MRKAHSMELTTSRSKSNSEPSSSQSSSKSEDVDTKKLDNVEQKKKFATPLDRETINDLRRSRLCFYCKGPYDLNHDYPLKPKGQHRHMEWYFEGEDITDFSDQQAVLVDIGAENSKIEVETKRELEPPKAHMSSMRREGSFRLQGLLPSQRVISLLDTGATHNFIDAQLVERCGIQTHEFEGIRVRVVDAYIHKCEKMVPDLPMKLNNCEFTAGFYVVNMGDTEVILGMKWLHAIGEFTLNLCEMEMKFKIDGVPHVLKAIKDSNLKVITIRRMERLVRHSIPRMRGVESNFQHLALSLHADKQIRGGRTVMSPL